MKKRELLAICIFVLMLSQTTNADAQNMSLPADLIVTALTSPRSRAHLARLDSQTMTWSTFYDDPAILGKGLRAINWSPDRTRLAIYRRTGMVSDSTSQLCLLSRTGDLVVCMEDSFVLPPSYSRETPLTAVTWSDDSQKVYFTTRTTDRIKLVEAAATTGQTLRTIFEYLNDTDGRYDVFLSWTPQLDYLVVGSGDLDRVNQFPIILRDITTSQNLDLYAALSEVDLMYICLDFSPLGNFGTAITGRISNNNQIIVFDTSGEVIHTVGYTSEFGQLNPRCPVWIQDESAFLFLSSAGNDERAEIFRYSLASETLFVQYRLAANVDLWQTPPEGAVDYPLALSPDELFIAADGLHNPNPEGDTQVLIIAPDGQLIDIDRDYLDTSNPIWVPPLQAEP